ncbi:T9SS type A sorting domain-containing protein [Salinimicrobium sp. TIG7-5_MAKvit]|uniref:T9SS type A sorting domain-containing protein n=1 Tax=Salinimicrobium sp. TIG7-5_MAKvit TaxID=3121289 RepID=UPI003C6EA2D3
MKKLKNIAVIVFFLSTFSYAGDMEKEEEVRLNGEQTLLVDLSNLNQGTVILFEDQYGVTLYKDDLVRGGKYNKRLYLEMVPQGIYFLKVDKRLATKTWKIQKSSEGVKILGSSSTIGKPHFRTHEEVLNVYISNPDKQPLNMTVEDGSGVILATVKASGKDFQKSLDFSRVPSGEYFVKLYSGEEEFTKKVVIN